MDFTYTNIWVPRPAGSLIFEVRHINMTGDKFVVDLQLKECSCRKWMLTGLPCTHAIACMQKNNLKIDDYEVTTYNDLQPPPIRKQPGRPKKKRNREAAELQREPGQLNRKGLKQACGRCGVPGHNKTTCKLPPPPAPTPPPATTQPPGSNPTPPPTGSNPTPPPAAVNSTRPPPVAANPTPPPTAAAITQHQPLANATRKSPIDRNKRQAST
ncbi:hypothetical protein QL285_032789 [Trifolium repens]|nr:hypothetical protein QL285_032789 [Trifolium repens]